MEKFIKGSLMDRPESFEKFYYAQVGIGGIIDVYEFKRTGGKPGQKVSLARKQRLSLARIARKWGLLPRPRTLD